MEAGTTECSSPSSKKAKVYKEKNSVKSGNLDGEVSVVASIIRNNMNEEGSFSEISEDGIEILSRSGNNSMGDYPHARHMCPYTKFSEKGSDENLLHCRLCFCYVCDTKADLCENWDFHSNASDNEMWNEMRSANMHNLEEDDSQKTVEFPTSTKYCADSKHCTNTNKKTIGSESSLLASPTKPFLGPQELLSSKMAGACSICVASSSSSSSSTEMAVAERKWIASVSLDVEMVTLQRLPKSNTHRIECCTLTEASSTNNVIFLLDHKFCYLIESYQMHERVVLLAEDMFTVLSHEAEVVHVFQPSSSSPSKRKKTPTDLQESSPPSLEVEQMSYRVTYMSYPNCVAYGGRQGRAVTGTAVTTIVTQKQLRKTADQLPQFELTDQYNYCPSFVYKELRELVHYSNMHANGHVLAEVSDIDMKGANKATITFNVGYNTISGSVSSSGGAAEEDDMEEGGGKRGKTASGRGDSGGEAGANINSNSIVPVTNPLTPSLATILCRSLVHPHHNNNPPGNRLFSLVEINHEKIQLEQRLALFTALEEVQHVTKMNETKERKRESSPSRSPLPPAVSTMSVAASYLQFSPQKKGEKEIKLMEYEDHIQSAYPGYRLQVTCEEKQRFIADRKLTTLQNIAVVNHQKSAHYIKLVKEKVKNLKFKGIQHDVVSRISSMLQLEAIDDNVNDDEDEDAEVRGGGGLLSHCLYGSLDNSISHQEVEREETPSLYYSPYFNHLTDQIPSTLLRGGFLCNTDERDVMYEVAALLRLTSSMTPQDSISPTTTLIVCSTAKMSQWNQLSTVLSSSPRQTLRVYQYHKSSKGSFDVRDYDAVITTYQTLVYDAQKEESSQQLRPVPWYRVILDEPEKSSLKSFTSQTAKVCFSLQAERRWCVYHGTPMDASLPDLGPLIHFLRLNTTLAHHGDEKAISQVLNRKGVDKVSFLYYLMYIFKVTV